MFGGDIICQVKFGFGKIVVFVFMIFQQVEFVVGECFVLVMCYICELVFQICNEYNCFSKYMFDIKIGVFYGGIFIQKDVEIFKNKDIYFYIIVGIFGCLNVFVCDKYFCFGSVRMFVFDECDKMFDQIGKVIIIWGFFWVKLLIIYQICVVMCRRFFVLFFSRSR